MCMCVRVRVCVPEVVPAVNAGLTTLSGEKTDCGYDYLSKLNTTQTLPQTPAFYTSNNNLASSQLCSRGRNKERIGSRFNSWVISRWKRFS